MVTRLASEEVDAIMYLMGRDATSPEKSIDLSTMINICIENRILKRAVTKER